jgi:hypothetical protein
MRVQEYRDGAGISSLGWRNLYRAEIRAMLIDKNIGLMQHEFSFLVIMRDTPGPTFL